MPEDLGASVATLSIVPGRCIGAGNCVEMADDYFDQRDDDATVVLLRTTVASVDQNHVRRAVNVCPVAALAMTDSAPA